MTDVKCCEHCGAKVVEYKHSLSKSLVRCLYVAAKEGRQSFNPNNLKLNYTQKSNFQKLKYWNLICKIGNEKSGDWKITNFGWDFLEGNKVAQKSVFTFRGNVVRYEGDYIDIIKITGGWKHRVDYVNEAVAHNFKINFNEKNINYANT
tara:strand:+ start:162 stop:608 length:447 start_codon:yes stop_codon:yes gene_type:complete